MVRLFGFISERDLAARIEVCETSGVLSIKVTKADKTLERVFCGQSDANIRFEDMKNMLFSLGFRMHVRGSHHHFSKSNFEPSLQLQPSGGMRKRYQVRQVREALKKNL